MTSAPLASCTDKACRASVQSAQQKTLTQIDNFDSKTLCTQLGYCASANSFEPSPIQLRLRNLVRHQTQSLDQRLESHDICSTFGQLKPICEHLLASAQGHRYAYVYKALLQNNHKLVDDDLREQLATKANTDVCTACKSAVQSGKDFWINSLVRTSTDKEKDRHVLLSRRLFVMFFLAPVNDAQSKINAVTTTIKDSTVSSHTLTPSIAICSVNPFVCVHQSWWRRTIVVRRVSLGWAAVARVCCVQWHDWLPTSMTSANDSSSSHVKCLFNRSNNQSRRWSAALIHAKPALRLDSVPPPPPPPAWMLNPKKWPSSNTRSIWPMKWRKRSVPVSVPSNPCANRSFMATQNRFRQWRSTTTCGISCTSVKTRARISSVPAIRVSDINREENDDDHDLCACRCLCERSLPMLHRSSGSKEAGGEESRRQSLRRSHQVVRLLSKQESMPSILEGLSNPVRVLCRWMWLETDLHSYWLLQCLESLREHGCIPRRMWTNVEQVHPIITRRSLHHRTTSATHISRRSTRWQTGRKASGWVEHDLHHVWIHDEHSLVVHSSTLHRSRDRSQSDQGVSTDATHIAAAMPRVGRQLWSSDHCHVDQSFRCRKSLSQSESVHETDDGECLACESSECGIVWCLWLCVDVCSLRSEKRWKWEVAWTSVEECLCSSVGGTTVAVSDLGSTVWTSHASVAAESWRELLSTTAHLSNTHGWNETGSTLTEAILTTSTNGSTRKCLERESVEQSRWSPTMYAVPLRRLIFGCCSEEQQIRSGGRRSVVESLYDFAK